MRTSTNILFQIFLLFFTIGFHQSVWAFEQQAITFHLDKSFYATGEYIWYNIYLPDDYQGHDIVLRASLFDQIKSNHQQFFLRTEGKSSVYGYFKIPHDWRSSTYQFTLSGMLTESSQNIVLAYIHIPIFNEDEKISNDIFSTKRHSLPLSDSKHQIHINLSSNTPTSLAQLDGTIKILDQNSHDVNATVSVAIREVNALNRPVYHIPLPNDSPQPNQLAQSIYLFGRLKEPIPSVSEVCIYIPNIERFLYAQVNTNGLFTVEMPEFYEDVGIQLTALSSEMPQFELLEPATFFSPNLSEPIDPTYLSDYLNNSRLRKKINMLYAQTETPSFLSTKDTNRSILTPDRQINIDDYASFPTLPIFLREVPSTLKYRKEKNEFVFKMFNPGFRRREFYPGSPLFIVDGHINYDMDAIANLDMKHLERLDLFFDEGSLQRNFGKIGQGGVVYIHHKAGQRGTTIDQTENNFQINGFQQHPSYPIEISSAIPEVPVFRSLIYWSPHLKVNSSGETSFSFIHSHDKGKFVIEVVVQTGDGEVFTQELMYEVK